MKQIILFLMLTIIGLSTSKAQTDFPCTADDFNQKVRWLDFNVYGWTETAKLNIDLDGTWLYLISDKRNVWPNKSSAIIPFPVVNASIWAVVQHSGQWYAVTWEWIAKGRTQKFRTSFDGGHMKRAPFVTSGQGGPNGWWEPKAGEVYGFMVSDFARFGTEASSTHRERSNVAWYKWGVGEVDVCATEVEEVVPPMIMAPITGLILED